MDKRFDLAFRWALITEGGEVDDADDRGGHTKYGISKKAYPSLNISRLTKEMAKDLYFRDYWLRSNADDMPAPLDIAVFDGAVNHGVRTSVKLLQQVLSVTVDGIAGRQTLGAIAKHDPRDLTSSYLSERARYYFRIVAVDPSQAKFLRGWLRRLFNLIQFIK